jgi:Predicted acetyltransferase
MQVTTEHIQQYNTTRDAAGIYELWQSTVGQVWPLDEERMQKVLAGPEAGHFVARMNEKVVGFVATFQSFRKKEKIGHLALLLVEPAMQRQGIGSALYQRALTHLHDAGLQTIQLGAIEPRFWCGLPTNLPVAQTFFGHQGWSFAENVYDLVRDIRDYSSPQKIILRQQEERVSIATATSGNITEVLSFEAHNFPEWQNHIEQVIDLGDYRDILVARDGENQIVGVLGLYSPQSHPDRTDLVWQGLLGPNAGGINVVGIAEAQRGHGIGIALVARATEILKERAVEQCYIDWVGPENIDFYAKLGYEKWRTYTTSWRKI